MAGSVLRETDAIRHWLNTHAVEITSTDASVDGPDLDALGQILSGVRIVGFGQASHGTKEFLQVHHRFTRHLAERLEFNVVAIECSNSAAALVNNYVLGGGGIPEELVSRLGSAMWDVEEFVAFVTWMRHFNDTHPKEKAVRFLGLDLFPSRVSREHIVARLAEFAPGELEAVRPVLTAMEQGETKGILHVHRHVDPAMARTLTQSRRFLNERSAARPGALESRRIAELDHHLNLLLKWLAANGIEPDGTIGRDEGALDIHARSLSMAAILESHLEEHSAGSKVVIWAHNIHVGLEYRESESARREVLGTRLRERFGQAYYSFGSEFSDGRYLSRRWADDLTLGDLTTAKVPPADPHLLAWHFARLDAADVLVDFRRTRKTPAVEEWLSTPICSRGLGWAHNDPLICTTLTIGKTYDGLIAFRSTSPTTPTQNVIAAVKERTTY